jgi:hypothetical protein
MVHVLLAAIDEKRQYSTINWMGNIATGYFYRMVACISIT